MKTISSHTDFSKTIDVDTTDFRRLKCKMTNDKILKRNQ